MDTKGFRLGDSFSMGALYPGRALAIVGAIFVLAALVRAF
jgi:hypothetical protein